MYDKEVAYKLAKIIHEAYEEFNKVPKYSEELKKHGPDSEYAKGYKDAMEDFDRAFFDWVVEPLENEFDFDIREYNFD